MHLLAGPLCGSTLIEHLRRWLPRHQRRQLDVRMPAAQLGVGEHSQMPGTCGPLCPLLPVGHQSVVDLGPLRIPLLSRPAGARQGIVPASCTWTPSCSALLSSADGSGPSVDCGSGRR